MSDGVSVHDTVADRHHQSTDSTSLPSDELTYLGNDVYSPGVSDGVLPSNTYGTGNAERLTKSAEDVISPFPQFDGADSAIGPGEDPHDYYSYYRTQIGHSDRTSFRQDALRADKLTGNFDNAAGSPASVAVDAEVHDTGPPRRQSSSTNNAFGPQITQPTLRSRKSSVKNLVDHINSFSIEEVPPLPASSGLPSRSRTASPHLPGSSTLYHTVTNQYVLPTQNGIKSYNTGVAASHPAHNGFISSSDTAHVNTIHTRRKPLFGEIISGPLGAVPGYGIKTSRSRSESTGSPIFQTINTPFPTYDLPDRATRAEGAVITSQTPFRRSEQPSHGKSDGSSSPSRINPSSVVTPYDASGEGQFVSKSVHSQVGDSRIPVRVRRNSEASNAALSPLPSLYVAASPAAKARSPTPKRSSPRRRPKTPSSVQSPTKRGKSVPAIADSKSPLLRANIIVPPPKDSPPLRSSRPRQPVSSASTAASRARMEAKFNQNINREKRNDVKKTSRPPELTDVDLKERRLRITQALSKSLEGQELKGGSEIRGRRDFSTSRTASPAMSDRSQWTDAGENRPTKPTLTLNSVFDDGVEPPVTGTPIDNAPQADREYTHKALQVMQGNTGANINDVDSPTLGYSQNEFPYKPSPIQTTFLHIDSVNEPSSALTDTTIQTEGTTFDSEPQIGMNGSLAPQSSILDHVATLRRHSPLLSRPASPSDRSEPDDGISVNLVLRGTTYLDDSEAIRTGYRTRPSLLPNPPSFRGQHTRDSWTSSIDGHGNTTDEHTDKEDRADAANRNPSAERLAAESRNYLSDDDTTTQRYIRSTTASDAYTIVNVVLQRHSANGIVDQQFVDDVYQRILKISPYKSDGSLDTPQVEKLCLKEIHKRESVWENGHGQEPSRQSLQPEEVLRANAIHRATSNKVKGEWNLTSDELPPLPAPVFRNHKYKSSLDSVEDWADTSPSIGDWMRHANGDVDIKKTATSKMDRMSNAPESTSIAHRSGTRTPDISEQSAEDSDLYGATPRQTLLAQRPGSLPSKMISPENLSFGSALIEAPQVPKRLTSQSQMQNAQLLSSQNSSASAKVSTEEPDGPEQRRLKRRRHVIKELVDTEYTYEKDLRVLCDIYRQTAPAALNDDDIRMLFGNVEQVQEFSKEFLMLLKSAGKSAYVMERSDRKKDKGAENQNLRSHSSSSTLASKPTENDVLTQEKDRETYLGSAFESSVADMEKVYAEYIRNRQAANQRLASIQKSSSARLWLKQCRDNSSDITNAWNLDALLVKPVQRITKYPLLLRELVEATPDDHPDISFLRRAMQEVTEVNIRINDVKKHTELVDQVLNRKRKDSDVRAGLSKAFGRRAEKLKQHVGIAEMYEDNEYNEVKMLYDNNIVQLMVVNNDCNSYGRAVRKWVTRIVEIASAAEAWVDVGHSNHQEAESKLRQFAMVVRGISTIALPAHLEQLEAKVLQPMQQAVEYMNRLKNDPKGLLQKRDKRLIDYAQAKNKKDKGERNDKKMTERMEQWEALNVEAKERMRKLVKATATLVQACQTHLIQMQMNWLSLVKTKLSAAMAISLSHLTVEAIVKDWQMDFDYQEASALSLSVCNGALLAEAVNMVNLPTPSTTLNGDDSPREPSFSTKRSASVHSDGSHSRPAEPMTRISAQHSRLANEHFLDHSQSQQPGSSSHRDRPTSITSSSKPRTPDPSSKTGVADRYASASAAFSHPSPVPPVGVQEVPIANSQPSVEAPFSPLASLQIEPTSNQRPPSSSTFFSAAAERPRHAHHQSTSSSIFSSAMPMSDSPILERAPEQEPEREPEVLFTAASVYEFNIDRSRREAGFSYLTYVTGEIFDVIGERGELWLAKNQDDPNGQIGWIWNKHFAKLAM